MNGLGPSSTILTWAGRRVADWIGAPPTPAPAPAPIDLPDSAADRLRQQLPNPTDQEERNQYRRAATHWFGLSTHDPHLDQLADLITAGTAPWDAALATFSTPDTP